MNNASPTKLLLRVPEMMHAVFPTPSQPISIQQLLLLILLLPFSIPSLPLLVQFGCKHKQIHKYFHSFVVVVVFKSEMKATAGQDICIYICFVFFCFCVCMCFCVCVFCFCFCWFFYLLSLKDSKATDVTNRSPFLYEF